MGVLLHSHDGTYYHAVYEFGARLQFVMDSCPRSDVEWLIRGSPVQLRILALLDQPRLLRVSTFASPRFAGTILIPPAPTRPADACVARILWLLRVPALPQSHRTILHVERRRTRVVRNMAELLAAPLKAHPCELVTYPDDGLPLHRAVAAFANASLVVGGHGAGLTNIIFWHFCRPGTRVIEVMRRWQPG